MKGEYQARTRARIVEILRSQDQNPRSWQAEAARTTMMRAARIARGLGFSVRRSKSRGGKVSSYYCTHLTSQPLRISDHSIPWTPHRESVSQTMGGCEFNGFRGNELIINCARSATWLRRAIILAAAGRSVPGA